MSTTGPGDSVGRTTWHLLTGEYPPTLGGVADYTRSVAVGLAAAGDEVHVWAPRAQGAPLAEDAGVTTHAFAHAFSPAGLLTLGRQLDAFPRRARLLVQYVPQAFGMRGVNVPFCLWLARRSRRDDVWLMLHEVITPWGRGHSVRQSVHGTLTRAMAAILVSTAAELFASTASTDDLLRSFLSKPRPVRALPIPSNLPAPRMAPDVARRSLGIGAGSLVGHFGTFGEIITELLEPVLDGLLSKGRERHALLLGRGGDAFRERAFANKPWADRVHATGARPLDELASYLAACDVVVQPYGEGVTTRRTTAMAALALGVPVVTNRGYMTERIWDGDAVAIAEEPRAALLSLAEAVVSDPARRRAMGARGRDLYEREFSLERTLRTLREPGRPA